MELKDCQSFVASVQEIEFEVKKLKEFSSIKSCMDFITDYACIDYEFTEDDFIFVNNHWIPVYGRGVDFNED